ncbi:MAG: GAF domain-containing protein [Chloroflexi bacterium]|nr:GAF domain-containing protein [Chloroflexota bacterium]
MTTNISFIHDRQFVNSLTTVEGESQELVDLLQKIVQNAGALLDVRSCSVALLNARRTMLVTLAALQKQGQKLRQTRFQLNEGVAGWVAEHREALIINNVSLDPRFKRLGRYPVGSIICVPLIDKNNFIGTLTASSPEVNVFNEKKVKMLSIFAEQAVLAITNARHAEVAQRQANQLEMLLHLSRSMTTSLEPDTLYRTILDDVQHLVPCDEACIYLYRERPQELYSVAEWLNVPAETAEVHEQDDNRAITRDVRHETLSLYDAQAVPALAAVHRHPMLVAPGQNGLEASAGAALAAPFISKDILYGVLSLKRGEPFDSEELRLVRNLSNMAAAALENASLFQKVRSDQEQLRAILSSSSDGIALLGVDSCFIEVNATFGRLFGREPQQIVGMECMELLGCDEEEGSDSCVELCKISRALQEEKPLPYIEVELEIQGALRSLGLSITPILKQDGPLCLLIAHDVTSVRDASRMKANFLSMITHELRSPLNAINGYLDLALEGIGGELNEQQREFMQRARAGSEHLYALIEDLLLLSRADAGQLRLSRDVIYLQDVIVNATEEFELTARDQGVTMAIDIAKDFPRLYADAVRIQQVLRNLISNALHFTPKDGEVTVSASVEDYDAKSDLLPDENLRVVKLRVSDTGSGIAPEYQERIFERFYQIPDSNSGRSGQGLGLAIVKMIVELHGGYVTVESTPGQGSTFTCVLPCLLS